MSVDPSEPALKPLRRTNSGSVIVFDPMNQTLTTIKAKGLNYDKVTNQQPAPRWSSRVALYDDSGSKRMIATLNLDKLAWLDNLKRHCGFISDICVMELSNEKSHPIATTA